MRGIPKNRTITYNDPVEWNEFTAYLLGYMIGDGNLQTPVTPSNNPLWGQITITSCDLQIITDIRNKISSDVKIHERNLEKHKTWNRTFDIKFTDRVWYSFFTEKGLIPAKSYNSEFDPIFPNDMINHFVRGLFDSDGCISIWDNKTSKDPTSFVTHFSIMGSYNYISKLPELIPVLGKLEKANSNKTQLFQFRVIKKDQLDILFNWLYKDSTIFMERKYLIFNNFKERNNA